MVVATSLLGFIGRAFSAFSRISRPRLAWTSVLMACFALLVCAYAAPNPASAVAGINREINFQGRLLNAQGATVPDGYYNIQFKIYQDGPGTAVGNPGGTLMWTESHLNNNSQGVTVKNGFLSVQLGSINAFGSQVDWNQDTIWLSMNIGNTNGSCTPFSNCAPDGEMVPMKRMTATPYSLNSGLLNGLASSNFVQLAQGVQTDVSTNTSSIFINKTGTGNLLQLQSAGTDAFTINNSGDLTFGSNANHVLSVADAPAGVAGKTLTVSGGSAANSGAGAAGGDLLLQGGNAAGTGNNNGGSIYLSGGTGTGTGPRGLVNIGASAHTSVTNTVCAANCTIDQAHVDNYGTVIVSASTIGITLTLPPPSNTTTMGRIVYITTAAGSQDYILSTNTGPNAINVAMRQNTTASMIWNGSAWTPGGASNATTLQATYANGTNPSATPEIKLDSTRGTIDIQDADTSIGTDLLTVRGSNPTGLGTVLFGVSNTGRVTIQDTSDASSSFRVLNSTGNYLFNVNASNSYVISNAIRTPGNEITNSNFEAGGSLTSGEEGWFGPAQASIVNSSTDAKTGNYSLHVTANATNIDVYGGTYYEVKPGDDLYFSGYAKNSAGANGDAGIQISWYDKDKALVSSSTSFSGLPGTSYALRKVSATVPAGAYFARASAAVRSTATGGTFYFDDFYMKRTSETADYSFRNAENSTSAFRIQSAGSAQTLFTADTTNNLLKVGDSTGSDTGTTLLVLDSATTDPFTSLGTKNGGLFYRSDTNSLKAVIGGAIVDICTTAVTCAGYSASASSSIQLQSTSPGTAQVGHFNITGTGMLNQLQTQDQSAASTNSNNLVIRTGNATGASSNSGNLTLDVGSATGTPGTITIGHAGVATTMGGTLNIQGSNALSLGNSGSADASILFRNSVGSNTVTLKAAGANPTSSWTLILPQNPGSSGDCLKDSSGTGTLTFSSCSAGTTTNLQDVYNNSSSPATITLADNKNLVINAQDTATDSSAVFNLQCTSCSANGGRFAVQNAGADVFTVNPNGAGIVLGVKTQIGSSATDGTQTNLQLDSYNGANDSGTCSTTSNQGSMYYNSSMGTIRACINGAWSDVSNPEPLGLLSFGVVPASGAAGSVYDLPALITPGASGPCKVSWSNNTTITWQTCVAYSGGQRVAVDAGSLAIANTTNQWQHLCLTGTGNQPALSAANASPTANMPTFSVSAPVLCLADIKSHVSTSGRIGQIYDTRTFTSSLKEAVTASTAVELGMLVDASGTNGAMVPAVSGSQKLYGLVVASNGGTSTTTPNVIVTTVGPGWVKSIAGTAGQFIKTSATTNGYSDTTAAIPNNSFYYSAGNTRTNFNSTCSATNNCSGSLYVNFIVR